MRSAITPIHAITSTIEVGRVTTRGSGFKRIFTMVLWVRYTAGEPLSRICTARLFLIATCLMTLGWTCLAVPAAQVQLSGTFIDRLGHPAIEYATRPLR